MDISKTEFEVMQAIWQGHPCTAQDIIQRLNQHKDWHEKTVKTLLGRLVKKGAVTFEKEQRRYWYSPILDQQAYQQEQSSSLVDKLFGGRISPLVANFASQKQLDKDDIKELKKLISEWENEHD